jgi:hypothetical protein
LRYWC